MKQEEIIDFIYEEAFLLDTMQWEKWLELYNQDARYWMPMEWNQTDPLMQQSLMYEDMLLLTIRVERLSGERTFSQKPKSRCHHVLQAPKILEINEENETCKTRTAFVYTETRGDILERFSGWASHDLILVNNNIKIDLKRIDLINFDSPFSNIQLFM
jgi:3-phenylpropionate/cinnamic acid dioxygenase small subunit